MLRNYGYVGFVIVIAGILGSGVVQAQPGTGRAAFPGGGVFFPLIPLAGKGPVQKDLGLEGDALGNVTRIVSEFHEKLKVEAADVPNPSSQEYLAALETQRRVLRRLNDTFVPQLKEVLTPAQFERLQQIQWQLAEFQTLTNSDLAKRLDLSQEQQDKITAIKKEYDGTMRELPRGGNGNREEMRSRRQEMLKERGRKALEVLTKNQQEKSIELKGKPFDAAQMWSDAGRR